MLNDISFGIRHVFQPISVKWEGSQNNKETSIATYGLELQTSEHCQTARHSVL